MRKAVGAAIGESMPSTAWALVLYRGAGAFDHNAPCASVAREQFVDGLITISINQRCGGIDWASGGERASGPRREVGRCADADRRHGAKRDSVAKAVECPSDASGEPTSDNPQPGAAEAGVEA